MGLNSGEYSGRYSIERPYAKNTSSRLRLYWIEALSITTIMPGLSSGITRFNSHHTNTFLVTEPCIIRRSARYVSRVRAGSIDHLEER